MPWVLGPLLAPELLAALPELLAAALFLALIIGLAVWLEPLVASVEGRRTGGLLHIIDIPGRFIRSAAASAYHAVAHSISVAASHRMRPFAAWFGGAAAWLATTSGSVADFAWDTALALDRATTVVMPREIGKATRPLSRRTKRAIAIGLGAAAAVARLRRYINHALHTQVFPRLHRFAHAIDVTIPRELGRIRARARALEREFRHPTTRWLRRIAAGMFGLYIAGAVVKLLARRFPMLFCRKIAHPRRGAWRYVCGMDQGLLDSLMFDTLAIGGAISIVAFARELQEIEDEAVHLIRGFIREA